MRPELQAVLQLATDLPRDDLAGFLGAIEQIRVTAFVRISAPAVQKANDRLMDVTETSELMSVSRDWLYRHADEFAFTRRIGNGHRLLRFSANGLDSYLKQRK